MCRRSKNTTLFSNDTNPTNLIIVLNNQSESVDLSYECDYLFRYHYTVKFNVLVELKSSLTFILFQFHFNMNARRILQGECGFSSYFPGPQNGKDCDIRTE